MCITAPTCCASISPSVSDVEIRISEEKDELLNTGGGIFHVLPHFEGEPFFVHNSDSIWVEGYGHALDRMKARWDPDEDGQPVADGIARDGHRL
jgi:NDP-sugar pyrophosphorylase family protein